MTTATAQVLEKPKAVKGEDAELREFRELLLPPDSWEDGFGVKAMIGGLFVGLIMTPASMYMQLVSGEGIGSAAQWVTIILFIEVARRAFTTLKRPEVYVLYYMAGASLVTGSGLIWNQFLAQSESIRKFGIIIPPWVAPSDPDILGQRNFFHSAWMVPIGLMVVGQFLQRMDQFGLGYVMYRLTSDVEKLPFPMAPVGAAGIMALADASSGQDTWRWRVFSFGAMLGMAFTVVYQALPAISGAFLPESISIFPLPFKDLTPNTETIIPAYPMILSLDIGLVIIGMVLPFWAMVGSFAAMCICILANPVMYKFGVLHTWRPGVGWGLTVQANLLDFYFSFGLGLTAAIAVIGFWHMFRGLLKKKKTLDATAPAGMDWNALFNPPAGRGDFSIWIGLAIYFVSTIASITMAYLLLNYATRFGGSPVTPLLMGVLVFYGFIYTPIISYVSARMEGIVGMSVQIPFVKEATFILTGYKGSAIWFAPFPAHNYGAQTLYFRKTELTGTKIYSMMKAEAFIFPVVCIAIIVFSQFIWSIAPVPSSAFPNAEKMWELTAFRQGLIYSSTLPSGQHGPFYESLKPAYMVGGLGIALGVYALLSSLGLPVLMVYGVIRGLDQATPHVILPQFAGAMLGRYYFAKRFGKDWPQYRVVFLAGYSCGVGLTMMLSLGFVFMSKSVFQAVY